MKVFTFQYSVIPASAGMTMRASLNVFVFLEKRIVFCYLQEVSLMRHRPRRSTDRTQGSELCNGGSIPPEGTDSVFCHKLLVISQLEACQSG